MGEEEYKARVNLGRHDNGEYYHDYFRPAGSVHLAGSFRFCGITREDAADSIAQSLFDYHGPVSLNPSIKVYLPEEITLHIEHQDLEGIIRILGHLRPHNKFVVKSKKE